MSLREEQCQKVCKILDDVLANRPTERDSLIIAIRKAFAELHWIPCSERLPETTDAVLTTYIVNGDRSRRYVEESSYYGDDESWSSPWDEYRIAGTRIEVIAWMPLPEPYKGVTE
jgi:hypothetical protein